MEVKKRGFTLVEILVVAGLLTTVGLIVSSIFFTSLKGSTRAEILKEVKQNGDFALSVMERMIRGAHEVSSTCDGSSQTSITILGNDYRTTAFNCLWQDDVAKIASNNATLTNKNVTLGSSCPGSLTFVCSRSASQPETVKINFTLSQKGSPTRPEERASATFQTTVSLRSY